MPDLTEIIKSVQRAVGVKADGIAGPITWAAIAKAVGAQDNPVPVPSENRADPRSESFIDGLNQHVQSIARQFILLVNASGIEAKIISGFRTYEEQANLYERYKAGGPQAAPPGYSNHNFGLAWDIGIFKDGKYLDESPLYAKAGKIGKDLGLVWGGDWKNSDEPHFEFRPDWASLMTENQALAEYRERLKKGLPLIA